MGDPCDKSPEDEQDMEALLMDEAERERELIDRAEAQRPDWFQMAQSLCLPSLAYGAMIGDAR